MTAAQMTATVAYAFDFEHEEVSERLVIRYCHYTAGGNTSWKELLKVKTIANINMKGKEDAAQRPLSIDDLVLQVQWKKGDKVMEDVNCDSEFMLEHMNSIGKAIRDAHHWVHPDDLIYLVMDNAGGHGTHDAIEHYVNELLETYKVKIIHQVPRGPEMNLLDFRCLDESAVSC